MDDGPAEGFGPMGGLGDPGFTGVGMIGTGILAGLGPSTGDEVAGEAMGLAVGLEMTVGPETGGLDGRVIGVSVTSSVVGRNVVEGGTINVGSADIVWPGVGTIESSSEPLALGASVPLVGADAVGRVVIFEIPVGETVRLVAVGRKVEDVGNRNVGPAEISLVAIEGKAVPFAKLC